MAQPLLQFFERTRPIFAQKATQSAVRQQLSTGLTVGAIVGFIGGIADALHLGAALRTRFSIAAVHRHLIMKSRDLFRKLAANFSPKLLRPLHKRGARGFIKTANLFGFHTLS